MIIGVIAVTVVQPAIVDIVHVRAVLHHGMFFARMTMRVIIRGDSGDELFIGRIGRRHLQRVFIDMAAMRIVEVAIVQIIDMASMIERDMAASIAVGMGFMPGVDHFMRAKRAGQ